MGRLLEADNHEVSNESLTSMDRNNHFWSATTIMECNNRVVACIDMVNALQRTWSMHSKEHGQCTPKVSKTPPTVSGINALLPGGLKSGSWTV